MAAWGSTRLRDYGGAGNPVLLIPSLINRATIFDLLETHSFARFLCAQGMRPLLLDWGEPAAEEQSFTLSAYITQRCEAALATARTLTAHPLPVIGYCMGGMLALALAERRPHDVSALVLLATPWDFTALLSPQQRQGVSLLKPHLVRHAARYPTFSADILQWLFLTLQPHSVVERFIHLSHSPPLPPQEMAIFLALEQWLSDGVPLAAPVALEALGAWYVHNTPMHGRWHVGGRGVLTQPLRIPTLLAIAARDTLVPAASSLALLPKLPQTDVYTPNAGHIGMVAGRKAEMLLWQKVVRFIGCPAQGETQG
jgi:polyhydroxyalkanoate synthase subunit PhaC